ncbi:MAG: hypothetical protein RL130_1510, partial [Actinomycetota bacterium]
TARLEGADKGDKFICHHAQRNLGDIELMARNQLKKQVKGAIEVIEVDAKCAIRR